MTAQPAPRPLRIDPAALALEPLDLDPAAFQSALPVQHYALVFEDAQIGLAVGIWDTTTMQESFGPYPGDEYITVLDGSFAILDGAGSAVEGHAGQSATFRNAIPVSWKQDGYLRKIYLTLQASSDDAAPIASAEGGVRVLAPDRVPTGRPGPDGLIREVIFRNDAGTMTVTLCAWQGRTDPPAPCATHRLVRVLRGMITLSAPSTAPETFAPGSHVFLPKGTTCAWTTAPGTVAILVDVTAD